MGWGWKKTLMILDILYHLDSSYFWNIILNCFTASLYITFCELTQYIFLIQQIVAICCLFFQAQNMTLGTVNK